MKYTLTTPCDQCPFLKKMAHGFAMRKLLELARGEFHCHRTGTVREDDDGAAEYIATPESLHCAGALIFLEKRETPHQMMRICERLGLYDRSKLNMEADVR